MNTKTEESVNCREYPECRDSFISWIFFIIGLVATLAIRVVTVLMHLAPVYGKIAWYTGVIGFFLFFIYKFRIAYIRAKRVEKSGLSDKLAQNKPLNCNDYALIKSILCGIGSKKERINYFFIFFLSAIAIILAIYMDFLR
jgi:hypothetical protein